MKNVFLKFKFFKGFYYFWSDYRKYKKAYKKGGAFPLKLFDIYPAYYDRFENAGNASGYYFYQDLWGASKVFKSGIKKHYDIGSRVDGFIAHCLAFTKVVMMDVRPLKNEVKNLEFIKCDCMNMSNIESDSISSLSTLHAVEHFGLGRYGDPVDPEGYLKAVSEIKRIVSRGGNLYFSVPVGVERLEFNGHRVFNPHHVVEMFSGFDLKEFSAVDDRDIFIEKADLNEFVNSKFSCGLFHFIKRQTSL
jgi:SAM-dependent methyltransferase